MTLKCELHIMWSWFKVLFCLDFGNTLGPSDQELLKILDQCDLSSSRCATPLRCNSECSLSSQFRNNFLRFQNSTSSIGTGFGDHKNISRNELESSYQSNTSTHLQATYSSGSWKLIAYNSRLKNISYCFG